MSLQLIGCYEQVAQFELNKLSNRVRFILAVISGDMVVSNRRRAAIEADLEDQGFERMPNTKKVLHTAALLPVDRPLPDP